MPAAVTMRASEIGPETIVNFTSSSALKPPHRLHDADHSAEQTDERGRGADGAEDPEPAAQVLVHAKPLAMDRGRDVLGLGPTQALVTDEKYIGYGRGERSHADRPSSNAPRARQRVTISPKLRPG